GEKKKNDAIEPLWNKFSAGTLSNMLDGCACLAMLWQSAWREGTGKAAAHPQAFSEADMRGLYTKQTFLPSCSLKTIQGVLGGVVAAAAGGKKKGKGKKR